MLDTDDDDADWLLGGAKAEPISWRCRISLKARPRVRDAPDSGFYYPAGYRISRIVKKYPAGLFGRIVVM